VIVDLAVYTEGVRRPGELEFESALESGRRPESFVWIGLHEPSAEELEAVRVEFELHELAIEDALHAHQRPKVESYGSSLFVVLKTARYVDEEEKVEFAEIQLFVGDGYVVTVRHGEASALADVRRSLETRPDLLRCGPSSVLHAVIDHVVDGYPPAIEGIDNDLLEVADEVFSTARTNAAERIFALKREVLDFQRNTEPLGDALEVLRDGDLDLVNSDLKEYFRNTEDHLLRVLARLESHSALLSDALSANLANISVRQNDDMRTISAWVAIAAIPTVFGGIYGMNFEHMPELEQPWSYPAVLALIVLLCFIAHRRFKRAGWL
jgi:magnesium transporter